MSVLLFAIIGATIEANTAYWVVYCLYCFSVVINAIAKEIRKE